MNNITVSISCITYNQAPFIKQCLDGFLMQKTNYKFEVLIYDDASTDGTTEIIKEYHKIHPELIYPIYQKENQYSKGINIPSTFQYPRAKGLYYCGSEGDDYWIDSYKIQKQVDFLEQNTNFGMVCTNYYKLFERENLFKRNCFPQGKYNSEVNFQDYLLDMSSIATSTVMFRKEIISLFQNTISDEVRKKFIVVDTPLWLFIAATSKIAVLPEETSVYRILDDSACHFSDPEKHYDFVKKGFFIADYFLRKYAPENKELEKKLNIKKLRADLFHGYRTLNKKIAWQAYSELNKYNLSFINKISSLLYYFGSTGKQLQKLTGFIFKLYSAR